MMNNTPAAKFLNALAFNHACAKISEQKRSLDKKMSSVVVSLSSMRRYAPGDSYQFGGGLSWIHGGEIWDLGPGKHSALELKEAAEKQGWSIRWMDIDNGGHGNLKEGNFSMYLEGEDGWDMEIFGDVPAGTYTEGRLLRY